MPRTRTRYVPAPDLERKLARSPGMRTTMGAVAELVARRAREGAPFPRIAVEIRATDGVDDDGAFGRVNSFDWISHFWEFGTIHHEAQPFMRPAAEGVGEFRARRAPTRTLLSR